MILAESSQPVTDATKACDAILVTGGAGFIGSHTAERLLKEGHQVIVIDEMNDYYDPRIKHSNIDLLKAVGQTRFHFYQLDICDKLAVNDIFHRHQPTLICHLAARAGVRASIEQPELYVHSNGKTSQCEQYEDCHIWHFFSPLSPPHSFVSSSSSSLPLVQGTLTMLELAVQYKVKNFVFASSSSVYGNQSQQQQTGFSESTSLTDFPISPYAATKKATECLAYAYHSLYGLPCSGLRFFTVYGPRGRPDMAPYKFVQSIMSGNPIVQFGDGSSQRDYTFIGDIVQGVLAALFKPAPFEIYNLGRGQPIALKDFIRTIESLLDKKAVIRLEAKQSGDVELTIADIGKAKSMLGYCPTTVVAEGMRQFIQWYTTSRPSS